MKNLIKNFNLLFIILLIITSCSKSDAPVRVGSFVPIVYTEEETPVSSLERQLDITAGIEIDNTSGSVAQERGFEFKSKVKGKINSVSIKLKTAIPNLIVTIWDATTNTAIGNATISSIANIKVSENLATPIVIQKDKSYVISLYVDPNKIVNLRKNNDLGIYPYTSNNSNISIETSRSPLSLSSGNSFPFFASKTFWFSNGLDFKFQRTE